MAFVTALDLPAAPGVAPLRIGPFPVDPPVVLAPMAGITNVAFRRLCREYGAGLYVCEMITSRALVERHPKTLEMITFDPDEHPRSMQLYGVDPVTMGQAVKMIVEEDLADHVDMNFGCPVPKVTRKGGGSALPYKRRLFEDIVTAAVRAAEPAGIPVTVKFRIGIDDEHITYLDAGRIAEQSGVPYRTVSKLFSGENQNPTWETITAITRVLNCSLDELLNTHPSEIFSSEEIKRIRKFRSLSAHGKRMVDIVLDEEYHRFLEQMYREEKINAFNLVDDIRQLSYEQIAKASRYVRALKNGFSE